MRIALILLFGLAFLKSFPQKNLSPKLASTISARQTSSSLETYSLAVISIDSFVFRYRDRITIKYMHRSSRTIIVSAQNNLLATWTEDPNIRFIDRFDIPNVEGLIGYPRYQFDQLNLARAHYPDIDGSGRRVLIKEQMFDTTDVDLRRKSFNSNLSSSTVSQHATIMATIIGGRGYSSSETKGIASEAQIGSTDFVNTLPDPDALFITSNTSVQNHSYGVGIENYYGNEAAAYDQQTYDNPNILHVFSSGNSGTSMPTTGTYSNILWANLSGNFKQAKNIVTVTALDTLRKINVLNSRGPAYDGRIKPELTAFGQQGTSDAAALVSGTCILLQQYFHQQYSREPSAAEIKSILITTADDVDLPGVDFRSGYGNVNADAALSLINEHHVSTDTLKAGTAPTHLINVPAGTHKLTLCVVWTDPPASQNATTVLVNDLNATLSSDDSLYLPWVLNAYPHEDSLNAIAKRGEDHLNTVEYFTIDHPTPGIYTLNITSAPFINSQSFSIAYEFEKETPFTWQYPASGDKLLANRAAPLLWNSTHATTGTIAVQYNNGNWTEVDDVNLHEMYFWKPADTLAWTRLRMIIGGTTYVSDSFLVAPSIKLNVAYVCDDEVGLFWAPYKQVSQYLVGYLNNGKLTTDITTDTFAIVKQPQDFWYNVTPVYNGAPTLPSAMIDYRNQGNQCYVNLFDVERYQNDTITIHLTLSSLLHVDHTTLYKQNTAIETLAINQSGNLKESETWYDTSLGSGNTFYWCVLTLANGMTISTDTLSIAIEQKGVLTLYPNPVQDDEAYVLTSGENLSLRLSDLTGNMLWTVPLGSIKEQIDFSMLKSGVYILELLEHGKVIDARRLLR